MHAKKSTQLADKTCQARRHPTHATMRSELLLSRYYLTVRGNCASGATLREDMIYY